MALLSELECNVAVMLYKYEWENVSGFFSCFFSNWFVLFFLFCFLFSPMCYSLVILSCNEHIFHAVLLCGREKSTQNPTLLMLWNALNSFTLKPTTHISNWEVLIENVLNFALILKFLIRHFHWTWSFYLKNNNIP